MLRFHLLGAVITARIALVRYAKALSEKGVDSDVHRLFLSVHKDFGHPPPLSKSLGADLQSAPTGPKAMVTWGKGYGTVR